MEIHGTAGKVFTYSADGNTVEIPVENWVMTYLLTLPPINWPDLFTLVSMPLSPDEQARAVQQIMARSEIKTFRKRQKWIQRARGSNPVTAYFRYRDLNRRQWRAGKIDIMDYIANLGPIEILKGKSSLSPLPKSTFLELD